MKRNKLLLLVISLILLVSVIGCKNKKETSAKVDDENKISLNANSKELVYGDKFDLIPSYSKEDSLELVWSSSNENILVVNDGTVETTGIGNATITVTYGKLSASCNFSVTYGNMNPVLVINHVKDDSITINKGDNYYLDGYVSFNKKNYNSNLNVSVEDNSIVEYVNGELIAKNYGETEVTIKGEWNNVDAQTLTKVIKVKVSKTSSIYVLTDVDGNTTTSSQIDLSVVDNWSGKSYSKEATFLPKVYVDGVLKSGVTIEIENPSILTLDNDTIIAKNIGSTIVSFNYSSDEVQLSTFINVSVTCPIENYKGDTVKFSSEQAFPIEIFGDGAVILSAKQGKRDLEIKRGKTLVGIIANGSDTEQIEVCTTNGGYLFKDLFVYTRELDETNLYDSLKLSSGNIIDGYYILEKDILSTVDMTKQGASFYSKNDPKNTYFKGTFDGQGHTIKVLVGSEGMFGGLGEFAVIKNTHFEFTFKEEGYSTGLCNNQATFINTLWNVTLSNLYVTTTNYSDKTFSLMGFRFNNLNMYDIYVKLSGDESLDDFIDCATQTRGALFRVDATSIMGPYSAYEGAFRNVRVITSKFMPIANDTWIDSNFVNFAKNDISYLGDFYREGNQSSPGYCSLVRGLGNNLKYFGRVKWSETEYREYNHVYDSIISDGGIYRYNSLEELASEIKVIGSWNIDGTYTK